MKSKYLLVVCCIMSALSLLFMCGVTIKLFKDGYKEDYLTWYMYAFTFAAFFIGIAISIQSNINSEENSLHISIGRYVPSSEPNEQVKRWAWIKGATISPHIDFLKKKNSKILKELDCITSCRLEKMPAKQKVTCYLTAEGMVYEATSASKEMALCIAFLKYCDVPVG